jgi:hypothetical protein
MEKKNKTGDDSNEDALADAEEPEEGGAKEPNHSTSDIIPAFKFVLTGSRRCRWIRCWTQQDYGS